MKHALLGALLSSVLVLPAVAQQAPQGQRNAPAAPQAQQQQAMKHAGQWRSSKMIGLDVYNQQNEKIGDINEILIDQSGKIVGYVLGVGGFLGMGEHDVLVEPGQLKFVNEPVRTAARDSRPADRPANPPAANAPADRPATTGTAARQEPRRADEKWWPDHAVMNASKDQLKGMPEFKYSNYN
jgi:hypothetical protein